MKATSTIAALAAVLLVGAGCMPGGDAIPSVERITLPKSQQPADAAAPSTPPAASPEEIAFPSGVKGIVTLHAPCPASSGDGCADAPYAADLRISTKSGTPVKRFRSDASGDYAVSLLPGTYVIGQPADAPALPSAQDKEFTVTERAWTEVNIRFSGGAK